MRPPQIGVKHGIQPLWRPNVRSLGLGIAALAMLAAAAVFTFATVFSQFAWYDDEGYMMLSIQGLLTGHPLYKEILTGYGPFYYCYEWLLHGPIALPLNHDITRALCAIHWLIASSLLGVAAFRFTRSVPIVLFVFMQAVFHLKALIAEPGHPQEIVVLLLALAVLVATNEVESKWTLRALAAIGAALAFTKINVGVFYGLALVLALASRTGIFQSHRVWFGLLLLSSSLLPAVLMRSNLGETWVRAYAWQVFASVVIAGTVAYLFNGKKTVSAVRILEVGFVFLSLLVFVLLTLWALGISPPLVIDSLVIAPSKINARFCIPLNAPYCAWSGLGGLIAAVVVLRRKERLDSARPLIIVVKAAYGVLGSLLLVADDKAQLGYLLPWAWLLLLPLRPNFKEGIPQPSFARTFLCLLAIWQGLQAYPVAGTQTAVATVLLTLVCSLCLHDAVTALRSEPRTFSILRSLSPRTPRLAEALIITSLLYLFVESWCNPFLAWRDYTSLPPAGLKGAGHLRLPEVQAERYQALTSYLRNESDTFITVPGFNSLYFWANKQPPTYFNISEVILLSEDQQAQVVARLGSYKHPLLVLNTTLLDKFRSGSWIQMKGPLKELIKYRCTEARQFGSFHVLAVSKDPQVVDGWTSTTSRANRF